MKVILASGHDAFSLIETLIEREKIDCYWEKKGRFVGAWTPTDYKFQASARRQPQCERQLGRVHGAEASASARRWRPTTTTAAWWSSAPAKLHPALYYKGLLDAARRRKITICAKRRR